jgi:hypothetical protein
MYHASVQRLAQEWCDSGALYITALHPGGASGNLFQSYVPLIALYADFVGSRCEGRNILRVFLTCGVKRSHSWRELAIGGSKGTDKVCLEGLYGPLRSIYTMVVGLDKEIVTFFKGEVIFYHLA